MSLTKVRTRFPPAWHKLIIANRKEETSESESLIKTKSTSDLYACNIDNVSETQIVEAVETINYSIASLISNIMDAVKRSKLSYRKSLPQKCILVRAPQKIGFGHNTSVPTTRFSSAIR